MFSGKIIFNLILFLGIVLSLVCCQPKNNQENTIIVGSLEGPDIELLEVAKRVAAKQYGLKIVVVPYTDYIQLNKALDQGEIDANVFQHQLFLEQELKIKKYNIVVVGETFIYPMGIYSKNISHLNELPYGSVVAIPEDTSNKARALLLLQKAGLIKLKAGKSVQANLSDIIQNSKNIKFQELPAEQIDRYLPSVAIAAINTNYAMIAGLLPSRDALVIEDANSPYSNLVVVRKEDQNKPKVQKLIESLHSKPVLQKAAELFEGQVIRGW